MSQDPTGSLRSYKPQSKFSHIAMTPFTQHKFGGVGCEHTDSSNRIGGDVSSIEGSLGRKSRRMSRRWEM